MFRNFVVACCFWILPLGSVLADLTYTLELRDTPPIVRSQIEKSMEEAIALYNRLGSFNKHFYVRYVASVPTANASIAGQITFGNLRSTSTAIHNIIRTPRTNSSNVLH